MAADSAELSSWNYFNYFTEIEEHFQRARGSGLFLLSPVDWALIETWKNTDVPLEAVLRGIDSAFEKWRSKKTKMRQVNSVAYCAQAVQEEAEAMAKGGALRKQEPAKPPFELDELKRYLTTNAALLRDKHEAYAEIAASLERIADEAETHYSNLEQLEQRLTVLEERMSSVAKTAQSEEEMLAARMQLDASLRPYRGKMSAEQLSMLEKQFLERNVLEKAALPRLSLFYLV
jgi:polyhydroxyalkanoate synthesis regulator phasin